MQAFTGIFHRPDAVRHPYSRQSASSSSVSLSATYPKQGGQSADAKNVSILISNTLKDAGSDSQRMGTSRVKLASPEEANELGTSLQKVQQQQIQLAADDSHVGHDPMRASTACPHHPTAHPDSTAAPTIFSGDKQDSGAPSAAADAAVHTPPCTPIPIPGPPGLPLIGHSLHYLASSFFPDQLVQWADTYGGVYRISLAGSQYVVVSDPLLIPQVMQSCIQGLNGQQHVQVVGRGSSGIPKSPGYSSWDPMMHSRGDVPGTFTMLQEDVVWRSLRRSYGPALGPAAVTSSILPQLVQLSQELVCRTLKAAQPHASPSSTAPSASSAAAPSDQGEVDLSWLCRRASLDSIGRSVFDMDFGCLADGHAPLAHMIDTGMHELGERSRNPMRSIAPWLPWVSEQAAHGQASLDAFHAFCADVLHTMRSRAGDADCAAGGTGGSAQASATPMWRQLLRMDGPPAAGKEMVGPTTSLPRTLLPDRPGLRTKLRNECTTAATASQVNSSSSSGMYSAITTGSSSGSSSASRPGGSSAVLGEHCVLSEIATIVVGGYETTANTLTWALASLALYPSAAMSLRRELYRAGLMTQHGQLTCVEALTHALGPDADGGSSSSGQNEDSRNSSSRGGPGASSSKDRSSVRLPYLDAWVKESMRLHTTAPNGTLRRVGAGGIQLGPYALEEGDTVWVPFHTLHLSHAVWGHDAREFKPERWLDVTNSGLVTHGSGQTSSVAQSAAAAYDAVQAAAASRTGSQSACPFKIATADASASGPETAPKAASDPWVGGTGSVSNKRQIRYMPFSDGARNCVGQHLAVATVKACVAAAACSLHLELSPRMGDVHEVLGRKRVNLTLEVDGGMWMHARPLNASELQCIMQDGL